LQGGGVSALGSGGAVAFTKTAATIAATGGGVFHQLRSPAP